MERTYKDLKEWPYAVKQLHLGLLYNSEHKIDQLQVKFPAYRMYNPTVQSTISHFRNIQR